MPDSNPLDDCCAPLIEILPDHDFLPRQQLVTAFHHSIRSNANCSGSAHIVDEERENNGEMTMGLPTFAVEGANCEAREEKSLSQMAVAQQATAPTSRPPGECAPGA